MTVSTIKIKKKYYTVLTADEGKRFKRVGVNEYFGKELVLGYSYSINGEQLDKPHKDVPEDFEEVTINDD